MSNLPEIIPTNHGEYKRANISAWPCWANGERIVEHSPLTTKYVGMTMSEQAEFLDGYKEATNE